MSGTLRLWVVDETPERLVWVQDRAVGLGNRHTHTIDFVEEEAAGDGGVARGSIGLLEGETAIVICVATPDARRLVAAILPLLGEDGAP